MLIVSPHSQRTLQLMTYADSFTTQSKDTAVNDLYWFFIHFTAQSVSLGDYVATVFSYRFAVNNFKWMWLPNNHSNNSVCKFTCLVLISDQSSQATHTRSVYTTVCSDKQYRSKAAWSSEKSGGLWLKTVLLLGRMLKQSLAMVRSLGRK